MFFAASGASICDLLLRQRQAALQAVDRRCGLGRVAPRAGRRSRCSAATLLRSADSRTARKLPPRRRNREPSQARRCHSALWVKRAERACSASVSAWIWPSWIVLRTVEAGQQLPLVDALARADEQLAHGRRSAAVMIWSLLDGMTLPCAAW